MIGLVLSSMVVAGAFYFLQRSRPVLQNQLMLQADQQGLWVAMEFVERDVRRAGLGFGFCRKSLQAGVDYWPRTWPSGSSAPTTIYPVAMVDGGNSASDTLTLNYSLSASGGAADASLTAAVAGGTAAGTVFTSSTVLALTDLRGFLSSSGGSLCGGAWAFTGAGTPANPYPIALLYNVIDSSTECSMVQVTGVTVTNSATCAGNLTHASSASAPYNPSSISGTYTAPAYPSGMQVSNLGTLYSITYSIDSTTDPNNPRLVRDDGLGGGPQVVAYGVEDLQVVPACDVNNNLRIDPEGSGGKSSDEWFYNIDADSVSATCKTYPQVRVSMVVRADNPDPSFTLGQRPALENRAAATTSDQFYRRVLSATLPVPNVGLQ
jgi:hypothetical protein